MSDKNFKPYVGHIINDLYLGGFTDLPYIGRQGKVVFVGRNYCTIEPDEDRLAAFTMAEGSYWLFPENSEDTDDSNLPFD